MLIVLELHLLPMNTASVSRVFVLVIAWARVPYVGYWYSSDLEPSGRAAGPWVLHMSLALGIYVTTVPIPYVWYDCSEAHCAITNLLYNKMHLQGNLLRHTVLINFVDAFPWYYCGNLWRHTVPGSNLSS